MIKWDNLQIKRGEKIFTFAPFQQSKKITFITGKNGYGKTTLLKAIAGLLPYEGDLKVEGSVTYLAQHPVVFNRSVLENIRFPLRVRKLAIDSFVPTIESYTKKLEIYDLLNQNGTTLSAGEKMKTAIIRSIIFKPDIVLLDEPTTNLDVDSIHALISLITDLQDTMTFMIVSHNEFFINSFQHDIIKVGEKNVSR